MSSLVVPGAVLLGVFSLVAAVDGAYLHLWKYRLYERASSRTEHAAHTVGALLFVPIVYLLLYRSSSGIALWIAVAVVAASVVVESWDVWIERASRADLGGLSSFEYWIHVLSITTRSAGLALLLASRPGPAWELPGVDGEPPPTLVRWLAIAMLIGGTWTAVQHVWLLARHRGAGAGARASNQR